jgi:CDP-glycerol glycerophosphotransferase (TagB/SpsB family)
MEEYFEKLENNNFGNPWKNKDSRKRIIWAPHHTILEDGRKKMSNFLEYAELFKELAIKYQDKIVWAFKPHPGLKEKLSSDKVWGIEKTNEYYNFWKNQEYTQLEEGYYIDLFYYSDAMIHDSGSFLNEYMYFRKPVLYLLSNKKKPYYNQFGLDALNACRIGQSFDDISNFTNELSKSALSITEEHEEFYKNQLLPFFEIDSPSDKIINILEKHLCEIKENK